MQKTQQTLIRPIKTSFFLCVIVFATIGSMIVAEARADEGMWLFSHPPMARLEKDHAADL